MAGPLEQAVKLDRYAAERSWWDAIDEKLGRVLGMLVASPCSRQRSALVPRPPGRATQSQRHAAHIGLKNPIPDKGHSVDDAGANALLPRLPHSGRIGVHNIVFWRGGRAFYLETSTVGAERLPVMSADPRYISLHVDVAGDVTQTHPTSRLRHRETASSPCSILSAGFQQAERYGPRSRCCLFELRSFLRG